MQTIIVKDRKQLDILRGKQASHGELLFSFSDAYVGWLSDVLKNKHAYQIILEENENFVGYIASAETLWPNFLTMIEIFVSPEYQGKGIGKTLLAHVIDFAKREGLIGLMVQTENENIPAQKLYERSGFQRCENKEWEGVTYKLEF